MRWQRTSTVGELPADPLGEAVAGAVADVLAGATVELHYRPAESAAPEPPPEPGTAAAAGAGPAGWELTLLVRLQDRLAHLVDAHDPMSLAELLGVLPGAGVRAMAQFRHDGAPVPVGPALRRALRDMVAAEVLDGFLTARLGRPVRPGLVAETIEFLIELSGARVESHDLTHGMIVADVLRHAPRLCFAYPDDVRAAKRAPLLFDGQRSVLLVDPEGRARTELQHHRFERLLVATSRVPVPDGDWQDADALVAGATRALGGLGFLVRADRSIWTFVDGQPLLVRRGEHWTAFPMELTAAIAKMIGGASVASLVARAAFTISAQPQGAILAVVDDPNRLDGIVSAKDRYDLRHEIDVAGMRPETRLHHLIDAEQLDEETLVRLAGLDGATVVDGEGRLLAYGAIVTSTDSQHEGARTAAAATLSETAQVVLKVSVDGDITVFRAGRAVTTVLGRPSPD